MSVEKVSIRSSVDRLSQTWTGQDGKIRFDKKSRLLCEA